MIGLITMLLRAFPSLERLFSLAIKEHKVYVAEQRRSAKHDRIDAAISDALVGGVSVGNVEGGGRDAGTSAVPPSGEVRSGVHGSGTKKTR